jgi:hypothetical protein
MKEIRWADGAYCPHCGDLENVKAGDDARRHQLPPMGGNGTTSRPMKRSLAARLAPSGVVAALSTSGLFCRWWRAAAKSGLPYRSRHGGQRCPAHGEAPGHRKHAEHGRSQTLRGIGRPSRAAIRLLTTRSRNTPATRRIRTRWKALLDLQEGHARRVQHCSGRAALGTDDKARTRKALKSVISKRLTYQQTH